MAMDVERNRLWVAMGVALFPAIVFAWMVPEFEDLYRNFGVKLPPLTRMLVERHHALWLLPLAPYALWWRMRRSGRRTSPGTFAIAAAGVLAGALTTAGILALYFPIFLVPEPAGG